MIFLQVLFLLLSVSLFILLIHIIINWAVHISMVKENVAIYGYSSYKKFKEEFDKCKWSNESWYEFGLWDRERVEVNSLQA